jgi:hypothetical protein
LYDDPGDPDYVREEIERRLLAWAREESLGGL